MDVVLELLYEICSCTVKRRVLIAMLCACGNWALACRRLWLTKHGSGIDFCINVSRTLILHFFWLPTNTESFSWIFFLALLALTLVWIWNLIHLFLLFFQIALLFFGEKGFVCYYRNIYGILRWLSLLWKHIGILILLSTCAPILSNLSTTRCLIISFLEVVSQ